MKTIKRQRQLRLALLVVVISALFFSIRECSPFNKSKGTPRDYPAIKSEGVLRVATEYNSISFYVDKDSIAGFNYELIKAFAKDKGLKLDITPIMSFNDRLEGLSNGTYDIIAYGITGTKEFKDSLLLTTPIIVNKQILVQRKKKNDSDSIYISNQLNLAKRTIHVVKGSPTILRIQNLGNEIGDTIYIKEIDKYGPEQLISLVAYGDIDYTVCDENIARIAADSLPQIDIHTAISFNQFYSWGVSKKSPALLDNLNQWLKTFCQKKEYKAIYRKYYEKK